MDHARRRHARVQHGARPSEGEAHAARSARDADDRRSRERLQLRRAARARRVRGGPGRERHDRRAWPRSTSIRTSTRGPSPATCASTAAWSSSASSGCEQRDARARRGARRAAALHVQADARRLAAGRGGGRRHALHVGSLLPALRRARRRALRVLEPARRDRRGDGAHPLRRARHLQLVPQPEPARRHGAHRRPDLGRPPDPRPRLGLVRARLRGVRLRVRHADHAAARLPGCPAGDPRAPRQAQSAAGAREHPGAHRRGRRARDAAPRGAVGDAPGTPSERPT